MKTRLVSGNCICIAFIAAILVLLGSGMGMALDQPIQIEADEMTAMSKSQAVTFSGNVDAKQGDIRIRADEMTIYYIKDELESTQSKDAQQVKKIVCKGKVEVTSKDWLGTSDVMHYFSKDNLVQLIGNAKAYKGQNMVEGERINYYLDSGKSEVLGATATTGGKAADQKKSGRVNMTILE